MINKELLKIFLTGYPSCGKSTYAFKIAKYFNIPLIDTDKLIEETVSLSISKIFDSFGEQFFRDCERKTLNKCIAENNSFVMACGGGLACDDINMRIMLNSGIVFYLFADVRVLSNRIKTSKAVRPKFRDCSDVYGNVEKELKEREKYYLMSNYVIPATRNCEKEIIRITEEIIK